MNASDRITAYRLMVSWAIRQSTTIETLQKKIYLDRLMRGLPNSHGSRVTIGEENAFTDLCSRVIKDAIDGDVGSTGNFLVGNPMDAEELKHYTY